MDAVVVAEYEVPSFARKVKLSLPVKSAAGEYVNGAVHTATIDGFWSLLKRGIMGSYHKVSRKYLPLYVAEFEWRYNNRNNPDIFGSAIARC